MANEVTNGAQGDDDDEPEISISTTPADEPAEAKTAAAASGASPAPSVPPDLEPLVERLRAGRCVLIAGNGLEATAGMPTYRQLIDQMLGQLTGGDPGEIDEARTVLERRPFVTAGFVRRRLGDRFIASLRDASQAPAELPEGIRTLGELPFRAVVTTSYSDLLTRAFSKDGVAPAVYTPHDAEDLRRDGKKRYVLKALGDPARAETVIWTSQEIQNVLSTDSYRSVLHDLYKQRSLLFLGFSAADIEPLFGRMFAGARTDCTHWAVLPGISRIEAHELEATFNIRALDRADLFALVKTLREALGDHNADAPPDDDDLEGWLGVLAQEPGRADALDKLAALEKRLEGGGAASHERLLELHLGMVEVEAQASGRARRLRAVAKIFEEQVGDLGKAFAASVEAYKEEPSPADGTDARAELERLAAATGMWSELLSEYTTFVGQLPASARAEQWVHVARLYGDKLGHADYALTSVDEALKLEPRRRDAQELRIDLLRKAQRWKELTAAIGARAEDEESTGRRFELYLEQADLFETRLSDGPAAARAYRAALEAEPGNGEVLAALEQLHRRRGEFEPLLSILDEKIKGAPAGTSAGMRREAASIAAEKLGDGKAAIARYEALRADGEVDLPLLRALEQLYEAEGRTDDYLDAVAAQADLVRDDKERLALYRRLAAEYEERPNGAARAAEWLEKTLVVDGKSEESLRGLERLYAAEQKWEALVDTYRRHAELPGADRVTLHGYIGQVFEQRIGDPHRAIEAYARVVELTPTSDQALASLQTLHAKTESWDRALALLDQRAELPRDDDQRAALYHEAGRLAVEKLADGKGGEIRYAKALGVQPSHVPSMVAMVELYRKSGEFLRAAKLLVEAEAHTTNRLEKTRMLVEAGELYAELEDEKTTSDLYLRALAVDPEHVEAGGRVSELLWKAQRFTELVPVLEMLTRKEADKETQARRWSRLGRAARELGQSDKAVRAYGKAAEIDPTDLEAQSARGKLLFDEGKWLEAQSALQAVLHHHRDDLPQPELVELFFRLGECDRKLGHVGKAKNLYGKALELDPSHRATILAQIDVGDGKPEQIIEAKRALLKTASDDEQIKLLTEIGEIHLEKLAQPELALAAWSEALVKRPEARALMHRCLDVHVQRKEWKQALAMLEKLTAIESLATVRAKLRFTRAMIHRDELAELEPAIALFSEAMEEDPAATPSARELEQTLEKSANWKELQRFYRKAIKRLPAEVEADSPELRADRLRYWNRVAELSLEKLGEMEVGIAALEVAAGFDRGNLHRHEQLADLYVEAGPTHAEKAIAEHQTLLRAQHDRVASYRALRQLYPQVRQPEKALAMAYALSFLKKGDPEDAPLLAEAKQRPMVPARRNLDDDAWSRYVAHPDEDRVVTALLAQLQPLLSASNGRPHRDAGLNRKERVEATDPRGFAKAIRYVQGTFDVKLPVEVYVRPEQKEASTVVSCVDKQTAIPCVVVGAPLLGDKRNEREMLFDLAKRFTYLRPDRHLRVVLPLPAQLGQILDAAIALGAEADGGKGGVGQKGQELKRALPGKTLEQVVFYGRKLKGRGTGDALATAWLTATELTATRAAFLLLGDLEQTARLVVTEPPAISPLPATHRLKELIWFSVTEECFAARKHLGVMP